MEDTLLRVSFNGGWGDLTLDMAVFFPAPAANMKRLLKILDDAEPPGDPRELRQSVRRWCLAEAERCEAEAEKAKDLAADRAGDLRKQEEEIKKFEAYLRELKGTQKRTQERLRFLQGKDTRKKWPKKDLAEWEEQIESLTALKKRLPQTLRDVKERQKKLKELKAEMKKLEAEARRTLEATLRRREQLLKNAEAVKDG